MRIAIILYALAGILLTATVTHYLSRENFIRKTEEVGARLVNDPEMAKDPDKLLWMQRATRAFHISATGPCLLALYLFAPFLSCVYGAIAIHWRVARGKPRSMLAVAGGMGLMFLLGLLLSALAVPC
jgi:hypothetical protein